MGTDLESKGQAKLLGECSFELDSIMASLSQTEGLGVKKPLKFTRSQGGNIVTVGRFVATFKIMGDYNPGEFEGERPPDSQIMKSIIDIDKPLPSAEFGLAKWLIRVHARCAIGAPSTATGFPSLFLEIGWSQYKHEDPSAMTMVDSGVIEQNRHPLWNEELLLNNPAESDKPCIISCKL